MATHIQLRPNDTETVYRVPIEQIRMLKTVSNMIDDIGADAYDMVIPLSNVNERCLVDVLRCAEHYLHLPPVVPEVKPKGRAPVKKARVQKIIFSEWESAFINLNEDPDFAKARYVLNELCVAANYLDCKQILDFFCRLTANTFTDKTPEQIREMYDLPDDIPEEEKARIIEEYKHYE